MEYSLPHSPPGSARHPAPCVRVFQSGVMARTRDVEEPGRRAWEGGVRGKDGIGDGLRAALVWSGLSAVTVLVGAF